MSEPKFKVGDMVRVRGKIGFFMVEEVDVEAAYRLSDGGGRWTESYLEPPAPIDYDAEIVKAAEAYARVPSPCPVDCAHAGCALIRAVRAKREASP